MSVNFPLSILQKFVETLSAELGHETATAVIKKSGLPKEWMHDENFENLNNEQSALAYARLQSAVRTYYGRGARGILLRIGAKLWKQLLDDASFGIKTQAVMIRGLPKYLRRKQALELLGRILSGNKNDITLHTLDLDLLFVDSASATTLNQSDDTPVCFVTLGLIRECLFWATGEEYDIEERSCKAMGARQCEFKINIGA
ncbi:MAG: 4-vinyl reductase 4VR [Chloroflexi bacterium OLB14]|nr:MAG: 4-vinyl reductase 4VR [Chloroflexi bacterium OLB14]